MAEGSVRRRSRRHAEGEGEKGAGGKDGKEEEGRRETRVRLEQQGSYWLTRIVYIRFLGFIYFVAFLVALHQNKALLGDAGLLPVSSHLSHLREHFKVPANASTTLAAVSAVPSLLWWVGEGQVDLAFDCIAWSGLALSAALVVLGSGNAVIFAVLWVLYHSLVNIGQRWYSFGWESQLLEVGFLAIFLCPVLSLQRLPNHTPSPSVVVWAHRWLLFRIMLGAGLIKIRGDQCWRDLTCMNYHYETQPVPNPLSYYLHQAPVAMHQLETLSNHVVELVVPFLLFLPRPFRLIGGAIQALFQVVLILSGNLSFLNWLTILPAIFCFDDGSLSWLFSQNTIQRVNELQKWGEKGERRPLGYYIRHASSAGLALLLIYLSVPVVQNLLSSRQLMNTSFNSLRILNTYGAFGSVTKERTEVVLEGTLSPFLGAQGEPVKWEEFEFKCKPGDVSRRPCLISPYHYRLDWLMWFAAFQNYQHNPWLLHLVGKLLAGDPSTNTLLSHNPFTDTPPKYIRALHYRYKFTKLGSAEARAGQWWSRELVGQYLPTVSTKQLRPVLEAQGWKWYSPPKEVKK